MAREVVVVIGSAHPKKLGDSVVRELKKLGVPASHCSYYQKDFADGEMYVRLKRPKKFADRDVIIIQSVHTPANPKGRHLLQLLQLISAAEANGARSIHVVTPYGAYFRQERKTKEGETEFAKTLVNAIYGASKLVASVTAIDVHAPSALPNVTNVLPTELWRGEVAKLKLESGKTAVFAPDVGAKKRAKSLAKATGASVAGARKFRPEKDKSFITGFYGEVAGRKVLLPDDIGSTFGTVSHGVKKLKQMGSEEVYALLTHGVLAGKAWARLKNADLARVFISDSLPLEGRKLKKWDEKRMKELIASGKLKVIPIAPLLAKTIAARVKVKRR